MGLKPSGIITLLTDFGLEEPYAGIMKGVILSIHPHARLIDITHQAAPGSVSGAALLIKETYPFFPAGTVHLAVVDPGVGGVRRAIAVETDDHFFVGPDNGIFWPIIAGAESAKIINLTESRYFLPEVSNTFHGRDIFAPVAAHLSRGVDPLKTGAPIDDPVELPLHEPREKDGVLIGEVVRADHFGNLITNIRREMLEKFLGAGRPVIRVGELEVEGLAGSYSEKGEGEPLAVIGSSGHLEISVNLGRACDRAGAGASGRAVEGMEVRVFRSKTRLKENIE
ncbi:MAG: SAM-dependent chlorinase/fluorinase [Deltaproteobacteria bacterium]|nr:SAM-dependent chlorinase/fluorinase [Deltaproteobacteria bacterium]